MTVQEIVDYVLRTPLNTNRAILTSMLTELEGSSNGVVQLRRDNDYNYNKIADVFVPANGEVCLVDTARDGLRAKCGDGKTVWRDLEYIDEFVVKGYYNEGAFYRDSAYKVPVNGAIQKIYIDVNKKVLYFYDGENFIAGTMAGSPPASETEAGTVKLYQEEGTSTDGTMSQKAITEKLEEKVEIKLNQEQELLVFH